MAAHRFIVFVLLLSLESPTLAGELKEIFRHDFRGKGWPESMHFFGDMEGKFLKAEPEAVRISLPETYSHPWGGVGLVAPLEIKGDFEATATVEVLHADVPQTGFGVGVAMRVEAGEPSVEAATLARVMRADKNDVLVWDKALDVPEAPRFRAGEIPCRDKVGRLRLKRLGTKLSYLWGPGLAGETFSLVHEIDFTPAEMKNVRLTALTGREPRKVDVRLWELQVSASGKTEAAVPARSKTWLLIAFVIVVLLMTAFCLWFYLGRPRQRNADSEGTNA